MTNRTARRPIRELPGRDGGGRDRDRRGDDLGRGARRRRGRARRRTQDRRGQRQAVHRHARRGQAAAPTAFADTLERSTTIDDAVAGAAALGSELRSFRDVAKDLPDTIDNTKLALGKYNEEQQAAIDGLVAATDANSTYLTGLIEQGATDDEVRLRAAALAGEYRDVLQPALGDNTAATDAYIQMLGLTPEQVETAIKLSGDAEARYKLGLLQGQIDALPEDVQTTVTQKILTGDYQGALGEIQTYYDKHPVKITATFKGMQLINGTWIPTGAPTVTPNAGPGAGTLGVAPLTAAGATAATVPAAFGSARPIVVNLPAGAEGREVVAALARYERKNGSRMAGWQPI